MKLGIHHCPRDIRLDFFYKYKYIMNKKFPAGLVDDSHPFQATQATFGKDLRFRWLITSSGYPVGHAGNSHTP